MGSYYNIGYGNDHGIFDTEHKVKDTYVIIISRALDQVVSVFYLDPDAVRERLNNYGGSCKKIYLRHILNDGIDVSGQGDVMEAIGWERYQQFLDSYIV
jgi:hypothetical protein